MDTPEEMWTAYLAAAPDVRDARISYTAWHFCDNQRSADELAELALRGVKRATAGALWAYELEGEALPLVGDHSIVTDYAGRPVCVIRTTGVEVVPFDCVTEEFAATEGEGDGSLAYWREAHWAAFTRELEVAGRRPELDMPVVCERFDVMYPR